MSHYICRCGAGPICNSCQPMFTERTTGNSLGQDVVQALNQNDLFMSSLTWNQNVAASNPYQSLSQNGFLSFSESSHELGCICPSCLSTQFPQFVRHPPITQSDPLVVNDEMSGTPSTPIHNLESIQKEPASEVLGEIRRYVNTDETFYVCRFQQCRQRRSRGRLQDYPRHYNAAHAIVEVPFWCPQRGCKRSRGGKAFTRKDHMVTHARTQHNIIIGGSSRG